MAPGMHIPSTVIKVMSGPEFSRYGLRNGKLAGPSYGYDWELKPVAGRVFKVGDKVTWDWPKRNEVYRITRVNPPDLFIRQEGETDQEHIDYVVLPSDLVHSNSRACNAASSDRVVANAIAYAGKKAINSSGSSVLYYGNWDAIKAAEKSRVPGNAIDVHWTISEIGFRSKAEEARKTGRPIVLKNLGEFPAAAMKCIADEISRGGLSVIAFAGDCPCEQSPKDCHCTHNQMLRYSVRLSPCQRAFRTILLDPRV